MIDFRDQLPKILSNFEHLNPEKTSPEEMLVLKNCQLIIRSLSSDEVELCFSLKTENYIQIQRQIRSIEESFHEKALIIFKWYPGITVSRIRITAQNS